ncbi:hypothetical protein QFZ31_006642 [Neobacillus niacini]|uniref:hypothetical protein n=1 Tax=Neobacillus driksii TaxID=3035913 RepID=UPI0027806993|nr:hypothetical protein [Neobacillus niacini]MDQ0976590.1 hypothetical protein [Neobacillus niacini]
MKTYFEIIETKSYRQLTTIEKEAIQDRQTQLVTDWQDETDVITKEEIFDELYASFKGLIKGMAYKKAERSFSVEKEDFEGIMNLVLVEQLIQFDRNVGVPFQPLFIKHVGFVLGNMYRSKEQDMHETTYDETKRLDNPSPEDSTVTMLDGLNLTEDTDFTGDIATNMITEEVLDDLFGQDDKKKTIIHMFLQDFKRNEIVSAVQESGKSTDSVAKQVNRTVKQFRVHCLNLLQTNVM